MPSFGRRMRCVLVCVFAVLFAAAQQPDPDSQRMVESGQVVVEGQTAHYVIRRLPVSSFPELPEGVAQQLNQRHCMIPQSYQAHHPENVVHASLERAGSSDWALLCSVNGRVSLLAFFGSAPEKPGVLATAPQNQRLQRHDRSGVLGFDWVIAPASPDAVHEAQSAMERRPQRLDHDALKDIAINGKTRYRFYSKGAWSLVEMPQ